MRRFAWKHKPSADDEKLLQLVARCTSSSTTAASQSNPPLFLVAEPGVTQFIVQAADVKHRVLIGDSQTCSCGRAREGVRLCRHLLFVMLKVMRLSADDPLAWQLSLTEAEIQTVLKGRYEWRAERRRRGRHSEKGQVEQEGKVDGKVRRTVEAEDVCVVCQEEMLGSEAATSSGGLCWCESGCGCALHARCMRVWAEHQAQTASSLQAITCPVSAAPQHLAATAAPGSSNSGPSPLLCSPCQMCRSDWSKRADFTLVDLLQQLKQQEEAEASSSPSSSPQAAAAAAGSRRKQRKALVETSRRCRSCKSLIAPHQQLFRCIACPHHLCRACFVAQPGQREQRQAVTSLSPHIHRFVLRTDGTGQQTSLSRWSVPPLPSVSSSSSSRLSLHQLQSRELTTADYDLLLQLDGQQRSLPLYAYLASSLPVYTALTSSGPDSAGSSSPSSPLGCALCSSAVSLSSSLASAGPRQLPCGHVAHHHCVSSSAMYDILLCCSRCQQPLFPGLSAWADERGVQKKKKRAALAQQSEGAATTTATVHLEQQAFGVTGSQLRTRPLPKLELQEERKEQLLEQPGAGRDELPSSPPPLPDWSAFVLPAANPPSRSSSEAGRHRADRGRRATGRLHRGASFTSGATAAVSAELPAINLLSLSAHREAEGAVPALPARLPELSQTRPSQPRTAPLPSPAPTATRAARVHRGLPMLHRKQVSVPVQLQHLSVEVLRAYDRQLGSEEADIRS